jgi:hypothetical protein
MIPNRTSYNYGAPRSQSVQQQRPTQAMTAAQRTAQSIQQHIRNTASQRTTQHGVSSPPQRQQSLITELQKSERRHRLLLHAQNKHIDEEAEEELKAAPSHLTVNTELPSVKMSPFVARIDERMRELIDKKIREMDAHYQEKFKQLNFVIDSLKSNFELTRIAPADAPRASPKGYSLSDKVTLR